MSPQDPTPGGNSRRFYGKYRGLVVENIDPLQIGRVLLQCPDVLGEIPSSWAMPCVPAALATLMMRPRPRRPSPSPLRSLPFRRMRLEAA